MVWTETNIFNSVHIFWNVGVYVRVCVCVCKVKLNSRFATCVSVVYLKSTIDLSDELINPVTIYCSV